MTKQDLKSADKAVRENLRAQAIRQNKSGMRPREIATIIGASVRTIQRYLSRGKAIENSRGRKPFEQQKLSQEQQSRIIKLITDKTPDQYKLPFALWTRKSVVQLVKEQFDISLCDQTMGNYLRSWGFTCQKAKLKSFISKSLKLLRNG